MKITIVQGAFLPVPPLLGGAVEKCWQALGQEFARRGHQVTHVSRAYGDLPARETDVDRGRAPPRAGISTRRFRSCGSSCWTSFIPCVCCACSAAGGYSRHQHFLAAARLPR